MQPGTGDQGDDPEGNRGVGDVEYGKIADRDEIGDIALGQAVDQVAQRAAQVQPQCQADQPILAGTRGK